MSYDQIKTGDFILSSFDSVLGYVVRFASKSDYNHIVVAIRIDPSYLPKVKIVKTGGLLCVLENKIKKLKHKDKKYVGILRVLPTYNHYKFSYRSLKNKYYDDKFFLNTLDFVKSNAIEFLDNDKNIIFIEDVIDSKKSDVIYSERNNMANSVCSELTFSYYQYCLGKDIFQSEHHIYIPEHFVSPKMSDFFDSEILLEDKSNTTMQNINSRWVYILFTIIILLLLIVIVWLIYKRKKCQNEFYD